MRRPKWREGRLTKMHWSGKASLKRWHCDLKGSREATHRKARRCHSGGRNRMRLWSEETLGLQRVWKAKLAQMMRCLVGRKGFSGKECWFYSQGTGNHRRFLEFWFLASFPTARTWRWPCDTLSDTNLKWLMLNLLLDTTRNRPAQSSLASKSLKFSIAPLGFLIPAKKEVLKGTLYLQRNLKPAAPMDMERHSTNCRHYKRSVLDNVSRKVSVIRIITT